MLLVNFTINFGTVIKEVLDLIMESEVSTKVQVIPVDPLQLVKVHLWVLD